MAKPKHAKRSHPRRRSDERRRSALLRTAELQARRKLQQWERYGSR